MASTTKANKDMQDESNQLDVAASSPAGGARELHMAVNVELRRLGGVVPACDGPDCPVCRVIADKLHADAARPRSQSDDDERANNLREALVAARDALAAFSKQAGWLPEQQGYSATMTDAERKLSQAVSDIDAILGADAARPRSALGQAWVSRVTKAEGPEVSVIGADVSPMPSSGTGFAALLQQWRERAGGMAALADDAKTPKDSSHCQELAEHIFICADELEAVLRADAMLPRQADRLKAIARALGYPDEAANDTSDVLSGAVAGLVEAYRQAIHGSADAARPRSSPSRERVVIEAELKQQEYYANSDAPSAGMTTPDQHRHTASVLRLILRLLEFYDSEAGSEARSSPVEAQGWQPTEKDWKEAVELIRRRLARELGDCQVYWDYDAGEFLKRVDPPALSSPGAAEPE